MTATPVELASGEVKVGNITFDPTKVLGRGCEGTFVYQVGLFLVIKLIHFNLVFLIKSKVGLGNPLNFCN